MEDKKIHISGYNQLKTLGRASSWPLQLPFASLTSLWESSFTWATVVLSQSTWRLHSISFPWPWSFLLMRVLALGSASFWVYWLQKGFPSTLGRIYHPWKIFLIRISSQVNCGGCHVNNGDRFGIQSPEAEATTDQATRNGRAFSFLRWGRSPRDHPNKGSISETIPRTLPKNWICS